MMDIDMQYESRIVCFIDILGFGDAVYKTIDAEGKAKSAEIKNVQSMLNRLQDTVEADQNDKAEGKQVTQFSDSVVISYKDTHESAVFWMLVEILWAHINLSVHGFLCRGAVVRGPLIHTDKLLFGPALNDAYKLEKGAALYPRVILGQEIVDLAGKYHARHHTPEMELDAVKRIVSLDSDSMYYVEYLENAQGEVDDPEYDYPLFLGNIASIITKGLDTGDPSVKVKFYWLARRYNKIVKRIKKNLGAFEDADIVDTYKSLPLFSIPEED